MNRTPARANVVVLKQILNLTPCGLIIRHALESAVEAKAHPFGMPGHLSVMLLAQLTHAIGLKFNSSAASYPTRRFPERPSPS